MKPEAVASGVKIRSWAFTYKMTAAAFQTKKEVSLATREGWYSPNLNIRFYTLPEDYLLWPPYLYGNAEDSFHDFLIVKQLITGVNSEKSSCIKKARKKEANTCTQQRDRAHAEKNYLSVVQLIASNTESYRRDDKLIGHRIDLTSVVVEDTRDS